MLLLALVITSFLICEISASPLTHYHVVHEKRSSHPAGWTRRKELDDKAILPMRVALTQNNLDKGHDWLMQVSHPDSEKYGQHWSAEEVAQAFAPSVETIDAVKAWLTSAGVSADRVELSKGSTWLHFNASVSEAESLLRTRYHVWEHEETGTSHVACDEYSLPAHIRRHVDFVYPSVHFDAKVRPRGDARKRLRTRNAGNFLSDPNSIPLAKEVRPMAQVDFKNDLSGCDMLTTPACLRALYGIPVNTETMEGNSFGVVEFTPQAYIPTDLDIFFNNFSEAQIGDRPVLKPINGAIVQQQNKTCLVNCESDLDLEYAMTLAYPQEVILYQVGDVLASASFNNFLEAFDASYCNNTDPEEDFEYPDPEPGGYKGPRSCGIYKPAKVISLSYAYNEHDLTPAYERRQCDEYLKLGIMGSTVLVSSGDFGVAGNMNRCINPSGAHLPGHNATFTNGSYGIFNPSFPGVCPYITTVGASEVIPGTNISQALASNSQPEQASENMAFSGGGFSNVFALPDYQAEAVSNWWANHPPPHGSDRFNNSRQTRGFPDISANGANYAFVVNAQWHMAYGTSASTPVLGSIFTLINQERMKVGKGSVGFVNPAAYAHPEVFTDVTTGLITGCGVDAWDAVVGWDPATGLGTPDYGRMLELWMSLP